ncbi:MAG: YfhO family protein [Candidatus Cloacimonetes bacterium]|nr:YfhO family protein [Candidatus Cloacimonadota bacterium]
MSQKKVNQKNIKAAPKAKAEAEALIPAKYHSYILMGILFVLLSLLYFPVAYQNMEPQASDISQWRGAAKSIVDYNATHKDKALWTQNMFSGMPSYMISFPNRYPFLESITRYTDKLMNWRILLLFIGGWGVFLILRQLKQEPLIAFFAALAFIFSCHWVGLLDIGHNTKFRAMMYVPWVFWAMLRLREKPTLLSLGLLSTFLITQLRENHPQISYYLYLLMGMYWIFELIQSIKSKDLKRFGFWTLLIVCAFGLTALAVMNPYLSTMEYSHHTMRGGAEGLDKAYAQGWSFHPKEIAGFIIPDFFGGIATNESNNYWGYMPFTQIYNYFGILVLALGVFALWGSQKGLARFLWITSGIFTILSFGSATPRLSDIFLNYLPYFNKFRVPSMTLVIVQFNAVILAGLGLQQIQENIGNPRWQKIYQRLFWIMGGIYILWLVAAKSIFSGLPFSTAAEIAQYEQAGALSRLAGVRELRLGLLVKSGTLSLLFLTVSLGLIYLSSIKKIKPAYLFILLSIICFADLWPYTGKHLKKAYMRPVSEREVYFQMQDYDRFLLSQEGNFRIFPISNNPRPAGEWAYYHQTINGYSAAKLKPYDEILGLIVGEKSEFQRYIKGVFEEPGIELQMPVLNMLSTKYIVIPDSIPYGSRLQNLRPVFNNGKVSIYENLFALPRAWFVQNTEVMANKEEMFARLQDPRFDPAQTALLESPLPLIEQPDSSFVKQTKAEMHKLEYDVATDAPSLLVLSEVYYPAGWKAYLDDKEIAIHPVNHILRGVEIPAGEHELKLVFAPSSYKKSTMLSLAGISFTVLSVIAGCAYLRFF